LLFALPFFFIGISAPATVGSNIVPTPPSSFQSPSVSRSSAVPIVPIPSPPVGMCFFGVGIDVSLSFVRLKD
jgi:hypothetical protein